MVGLGVVMLGMWAITWYFSTKAGAAMLGQTTPALKADDIVNPINTVWVLVAAFLVFFMQAGFMMLEA
ncbi:MAG: ammonium transporter, Amt family, partial [Actinomycetota bacterium]|nr:ammonium transporter, Amt family [Actinomycetota bacterium]